MGVAGYIYILGLYLLYSSYLCNIFILLSLFGDVHDHIWSCYGAVNGGKFRRQGRGYYLIKRVGTCDILP